ncbi:bifunctional metallophosphatase/5'-nucleotidase [Bacillus suaedae]|uniref:Bifunctional metallophosphatase/5'-nucleotidase n=1 Tax=Halalkalibacter suaedae TaxID=2822140 RepID=A0A941AN45_9BACI|nr:bifunctional UDP-sugar hydrolase/5'-nucleotidase [Bacillus suaedae]MBP3949917.1 bifunctional metallophosphatase/5'-nucleotidase [Bacillus suaedae]
MTTERITIFHTNDIHSGFEHWSEIVAYVKSQRDASTLYLDLGDHADRSHPITEATSGKGNVELLNAADVDYVTIGNNEGITFAKEDLSSLYDHASFPVLVANLREPNNERPRWCKDYVIHQMPNGAKIAVIGLTAPFYRFYEQLGWLIKDPVETLERYLPTLRHKADIVILMSHLGLHKDQKLAEAFEGIDVIIGAHTHHVLIDGLIINETLIAQAGKHGAFLGRITIDFDLDRRQIVDKKSILLNHFGKTDQQTDQLLINLYERSKLLLSETIATLPKELEVNWQHTTEIVQLLCDAVTSWCNEEIGMINAGVLLRSIPQGRLTKEDILTVCPHPINPCTVRLKGDELLRTLQRAQSKEITELELKGFGFRGKVLGKTIFTGIDYQLNENNEVIAVSIMGAPLEEERIYTLATLDMYTFGFLFPDITAAEEKVYFMPEMLRDVLAWKLNEIWT